MSEEDINKIRIAGENAFSKGDLKEAAKWYSQLIDLDSRNERNYYKRFRVYLSDRKYSRALADLSMALEINPTYTKALSQRGKVHLMLGHCSAAKKDYERLHALSSTEKGTVEGHEKARSCENLMDMAEKAQARGEYQHAYDAMTQIIEDYASSSASLLMERAALSVSLGNVFDAIADSGHALKLDGNNIAWLQFRGELFYNLGDAMSIDAALQHFKQALHSDPEHKGVKTLYRKVKKLARFLKSIQSDMDSGAHENAASTITDALTAVDPVNKALSRDLWANLCECEFHRRKASEMKEACSTAIRFNDENAMAYARLGEALKMLEEYEESVRVYSRAHDLDNGNNEIKDGFRKAQAALKQSKTKNFYKILGVARTAIEREIKKAYRKKALEWHPDKHADKSEELQEKARHMFQDIAEAYEILSSEDLRARYDRGEDVTGNPESQQQQQHPFFHRRGGGGGGRTFHFNFG